MPRRHPPIPIRLHYSRDLKQHVIYQTYMFGYSSTRITIELNIDLHIVQRVRKLYSEIGEVSKDRMYMGRPPLMSMGATEVCTVRICQMCIYSSCWLGNTYAAYARFAWALTRHLSWWNLKGTLCSTQHWHIPFNHLPNTEAAQN